METIHSGVNNKIARALSGKAIISVRHDGYRIVQIVMYFGGIGRRPVMVYRANDIEQSLLKYIK